MKGLTVKPIALCVLVGLLLVFGVLEIGLCLVLLGLMPKGVVVVILSGINFLVVALVIKHNTRAYLLAK